VKSIPPGPKNFNCSSDDEPFESDTKYPKIRQNEFNCAKITPFNVADHLKRSIGGVSIIGHLLLESLKMSASSL